VAGWRKIASEQARAGEKAAAGDLRAEKSIICQPTIYSRNNGISLRLLLLLPSFHLTGPLFLRSSTARFSLAAPWTQLCPRTHIRFGYACFVPFVSGARGN